MYNTNNSSPMVTNCTFSGNTASPPIGGGGMYNGGGSPTVTNCILWGDRPDEISNNTSSPTVSFSDVQGGYTGTGNIDADPLFVDANGADNTVGTDDDDLRLSAGSPCIDAADNSIVAIYRALDPSTPETACATLQEIGCSEDESGCGAGFNSDVCVTGLAPGEMYYIQLAARTDEDRGVYRLDIESPCPGVPPDCPLGEITWMDPPDGVIDARQAHMVDDPAFLQGIDTILVGAPEGADPSCWTLSESDENTLRHPPYPPELDTNDIRGAESNGDGTYTIRLARPITPGEVTTITYTDNSGVASTGCFISHPANVDGINEGQSTIY